MLDHLESLGLLIWRWDYINREAIYWITEPGRPRQKLDTRRAEKIALRLCQQQGIFWLPIPHPGGETQRAETLQKIEELKRGILPTESNTGKQILPVRPVPFDIAAYPALRQRLHDKPNGDRSLQAYTAARHCIELGLSDGQSKWFLAQYAPFLDKFRGRADADRELDRVVAKALQDAS